MTPEHNSEGGYTLTKENLMNLRSWINAAKGYGITRDGWQHNGLLQCLDDALALLPKRDRDKEGGA